MPYCFLALSESITKLLIRYNHSTSTGLFDVSRKVFLSQNCISEQAVKKYVMKLLEEHRIPKENILDDSKMDVVSTGDYLIRCIGGTLVIHKIELSHEGLPQKLLAASSSLTCAFHFCHTLSKSPLLCLQLFGFC